MSNAHVKVVPSTVAAASSVWVVLDDEAEFNALPLALVTETDAVAVKVLTVERITLIFQHWKTAEKTRAA